MRQKRRLVTLERNENETRLPDYLAQGIVLLQHMEVTGIVEEVGQRLRVQREGGFPALDALIFLVLYFASPRRYGLKEFWYDIREHRNQLGAVVGRERLPSSSSVSRLLSAVKKNDYAEFIPWLLLEGCQSSELLKEPSCLFRDVCGQGWHVFDVDATSTALRQRALPEGRDLPPGRRRAEDAKLGYMGRKRGDVKLSRTTLQHAGSGLWLGNWTGAGNGNWRDDSQSAIDVVGRTCDLLGHQRTRALLRVDGAGGNTPFMTACNEAGICYLARWSQYGFLDEPEFQSFLNQAKWYEVRDSGSGPRRQAAEIGVMELAPSTKAVRDDGSRYEPVSSRVVVSRFKTNQDRGAGRSINGWTYEVYATSLNPSGWPAPEVVTAYYGRTAIENRFYQEDRELRLDRILSYNIPGQNLANLIGLYVWNQKMCRGMRVTELPTVLPEQQTHEPIPVTDGPYLGTSRQQASDFTTGGPAHPASERLIPNQAPLASSKPGAQPTTAQAQFQLDALMGRMDWKTLLKPREGWIFSPESQGLLCPDGVAAPLYGVFDDFPPHRTSLRFRVQGQPCSTCTLLPSCSKSRRKDFRKEVTIPISEEDATTVSALLAQSRPGRYKKREGHKARPILTSSSKRHWAPSPVANAQPSMLPMAAVIRPAVLRAAFSEACKEVEVHIQLNTTQTMPPRLAAIASTPAERQARRKTWAERHEYNLMPVTTSIHIRFLLKGNLADKLCGASSAHPHGEKPLLNQAA